VDAPGLVRLDLLAAVVTLVVRLGVALAVDTSRAVGVVATRRTDPGTERQVEVLARRAGRRPCRLGHVPLVPPRRPDGKEGVDRRREIAGLGLLRAAHPTADTSWRALAHTDRCNSVDCRDGVVASVPLARVVGEVGPRPPEAVVCLDDA